MAAVAVAEGALDLEALAKVLDTHLPSYARPLFLRTPDKLQKTSTYKIVKVAMQKQVRPLEIFKVIKRLSSAAQQRKKKGRLRAKFVTLYGCTT